MLVEKVNIDKRVTKLGALIRLAPPVGEKGRENIYLERKKRSSTLKCNIFPAKSGPFV